MQFVVEVQWSAGTWTDESAYVRRVKTWEGVARPGDAVASIGRCTIELDNNSGRFSPGATSELAGLVLPRKQVRVKASDNVTTWVLWRGFIDEIQPESGDLARSCVLVCVDGVALLDHQRISVEHADSKAVDEAVFEVVSSAYTPPTLAIGDNGDSLDHYGHTWQPETTRAIDALRGICESVYGRFWVARDGAATFQIRGERQNFSVAAAWEFGAAAAAPIYADKVLSYAPIAYWKLDEASGSVAADSSGNGFDGTAYGVTWGESGIGDGETAALFDGINDYVNVFSAGLAAVFSFSAGTWSLWVKKTSWDAAVRVFLAAAASTPNRVYMSSNIYDETVGAYVGQGTAVSSKTSGGSTAWVHVALTWDASAGALVLFVDGEAQTPGSITVAAVGTLTAFSLGKNYDTHYYCACALAHVAVFDSVLSDAVIVDLAAVS